jgi:processive 1,2-diacylglycerol beta-glucosyltransferase
MIMLRDKETGNPIGTITDAQLQFLADQLEEEWAEDTDYWLDQSTIDLLAERGADGTLVDLLRRSMGEREEMEITWSRR